MIDWAQFKGQYIKWDNYGQLEEGEVRAIRIGSYKDKQYPEIVLDTYDGTRILSASQAALMRQLADDPPAVGDWLKVRYVGEGEARAGQSPVKLFEVEVTHATSASTASDVF